MYMVGVAQLVERRIVIPVVVGSIPIVHPSYGSIIMLKKIMVSPLSLFYTSCLLGINWIYSIALAQTVTPQKSSRPVPVQGSFGAIAHNALGPLNVMIKLALTISFMIGAGFVMAALTQYMAHRKNPVQVPISRPITYLIFGLLLIALPIVAQLSRGWDIF